MPLRHADLRAGDTVHVHGVVVGIDYSHAQVMFGDLGYRHAVHVPRAAITAVDKTPDAKLAALLADLCGPHGRARAA